jgi:hypothetical protein
MKNDLQSPRMWIYIVMLVVGMTWGVYFIVQTIRNGG